MTKIKRRIIPYNSYLKQLARKLRNDSTFGEILLWQQLRNKQVFGYDFHRQKPLLNYIVDFYCSELNLVIEIDGKSHDQENIHIKDVKRQTELEGHNLHFLRFTEMEIRQNIHGAVDVIEHYILEFEKHTPACRQAGLAPLNQEANPAQAKKKQ